MRARVGRWFKRLTLGYPMKRDEGGSLFFDRVARRAVFGYTDTLGRKWMAFHRFDLDRCPRGSK